MNYTFILLLKTKKFNPLKPFHVFSSIVAFTHNVAYLFKSLYAILVLYVLVRLDIVGADSNLQTG